MSLSSAVAALGLAGGVPRRTADGPPWPGRPAVRRGRRLVRARLVPRIRAGSSGQPDRCVRGRDGRLASLARRIGAWPSVSVVTAVTVAAAELVNRTATRW